MKNTPIEAIPFQRAESKQLSQGIQLKPWSLALGLMFILLLAAALFMFMAKAIRIEINPGADTFRFTSGFQYQLGERYLMLPGEHHFTSAKEGYEILSTAILVGSDAYQDFAFDLNKLPGILQITTRPETEAEISIDQQVIGSSPLSLNEISSGLHDIHIKSRRYLDYDTEIDIVGKRELQSIEAILSPAWAMVSLSSQPEANIIIDGQLSAKTPNTVEILQGERSLEIQKKGFKTWQVSLSVLAGKDFTLDTVILEKSDGKVSIRSTPEGANININGQYKGQTPAQLSLIPGISYTLSLSKAGYQSFQHAFKLSPDETISLNNRLIPVLGTIQLMVTPEDAELFVDGKSQGQASQRLSLSAHQHEIIIKKEGYAPYTQVIQPQPGAIQQLLIQLQTNEQARVASIPTEIKNAAGQTLKLILPGHFEMGAKRREPGRRSNEIIKQVELTRAFYLSRGEVSNQAFKLFNPAHDSGIIGRALLSEDERPVVNVSWEDAAAFCNWLSQKEGLPPSYKLVKGKYQAVAELNTGYRLPTEAEWAWSSRYAAGDAPSRFPWGNNMPPLEIMANYADESAISMAPYYIKNYNDNFRGPSPTGTFPANELGIMDLGGNVSEWIHDLYSVKIPNTTLLDPVGPETGDYHVIRGSSYQHGRFSELRWTYRDYGQAARFDLGFRVARYLE